MLHPARSLTAHVHGYTSRRSQRPIRADQNGEDELNFVNGGLRTLLKMSGQLGTISVVPINPGAQADTNLATPEPSMQRRRGTITRNTAKTFAKNAPAPVA
jgi:hypothetical protein